MLIIGIKGVFETVVTENTTAKAMGSGELEVFSTPSMIAGMEYVAYSSVAGYLEQGQGTVGTSLSIKHVAATPVGMKLRFESELVAIDRKRLIFDVFAYDEAGMIGSGTHERFIVDNEKFMEKASSKSK